MAGEIEKREFLADGERFAMDMLREEREKCLRLEAQLKQQPLSAESIADHHRVQQWVQDAATNGKETLRDAVRERHQFYSTIPGAVTESKQPEVTRSGDQQLYTSVPTAHVQ